MRATLPNSNMDPLIRPEDILFKERPEPRLSSRNQWFFIFGATVVVSVVAFVLAFSVTQFFKSHRIVSNIETNQRELSPPLAQVQEKIPSPPSVPPASTLNGKTVVIKADDNLWQILIDQYGKFSPELLQFVLKANPALAKGKGDRLAIGDRVFLPAFPSKTN